MPRKIPLKASQYLAEHDPKRLQALLHEVYVGTPVDPKEYTPDHIKRTRMPEKAKLPILASMYYYNHTLLTVFQVYDEAMRHQILARHYSDLAEIYGLENYTINQDEAAHILSAKYVAKNRRPMVWYFKNCMNMQTKTICDLFKVDSSAVSRWVKDAIKLNGLYVDHPLLESIIKRKFDLSRL